MTRRELLLLAAAAPCAAQFTSSVRVVNVFVTVRNKKGDIVRGLRREDFELHENGRKQSVRYFSAESDLPLTLGLLFDVSGSQRSVLERQKGAARTFLGKMLRPGDTAFFVAFDRDVTMQDAEGFEVLTAERTGNRGTALFDTLLNRHGVQWLVELTATLNFFVFVSGIANAFEVDVPADGDPIK